MDISAANWNEDDNANTTAAPDGAPEGMAPSGVNNVLRAHQGALKRFYNWTTPRITGGSGTAYSLSYAVAPGALVDGMTHLVQFNAANGNAPTLNVNSLGAIPIHYYSAGAWRPVPAALWGGDQIFCVAYHGSSGTYRLLHFDNRTGEAAPFAGATAPAGTLLCFGQAISRTSYVGLFTALGTAHGGGDGSTTFNLPDLRGRVAAGKDNMGGANASRLTSVMNSTTLGVVGGAQTHLHSVNITTAGPGDQQIVDFENGNANVASINHTHLVTGATASDSSVQPTLILNYVIRL